MGFHGRNPPDATLAARPPRAAWSGGQARGLRDRLQPALLDRLTDEAPQRRSEAREQPLMSHAQLRAAVLRDLRWLLNTVNLESTHALTHLSHTRASALNFGVRAMAGRRMSEIDWSDLEQSILDAIVRFEPRILAETLTVICDTDTDALAHHNIVSLRIRGMLWCVPYPQEFLFRTDIDLESGHMDLADAAPQA